MKKNGFLLFSSFGNSNT